MLRFRRIQRRRSTGRFHGAETTATGACVTPEHDGRCSCPFFAPPTFSNIGALGLLAYRGQIQIPQFAFDPGVIVPSRQNAPFQPVWLPLLFLPTRCFDAIYRLGGGGGGILFSILSLSADERVESRTGDEALTQTRGSPLRGTLPRYYSGSSGTCEERNTDQTVLRVQEEPSSGGECGECALLLLHPGQWGTHGA